MKLSLVSLLACALSVEGHTIFQVRPPLSLTLESEPSD